MSLTSMDSPFCIVLRLYCLLCQVDGALCPTGMRFTSAFLEGKNRSNWATIIRALAREDFSLLASTQI
jgi:hypothetical protein